MKQADQTLSSSLNEKVVFVVGNSRSGTTLMARILENQGSVFFLREFHFFEELWSPSDIGRNLTPEQLTQLIQRFFCIQNDGYLNQGKSDRYSLETEMFLRESALPKDITADQAFVAVIIFLARKNGRQIPCDQTPRNVYYLKEIFQFFPQALVINMVRDPRDILYSQKYKWRRRFLGGKSYTPWRESLRTWVNYHPITISKLWKAAVSAARRVEDMPRMITVRYEDLISKQEETVKRVCDFVGLPYDRKMLDVPQEGSSDRQDKLGKKGISAKNYWKWQDGGLNKTEIYLCHKMTEAVMKREGYQVLNVRPNVFTLVGYLLLFPLKLALALLLNLRRMKSITETIRRRIG